MKLLFFLEAVALSLFISLLSAQGFQQELRDSAESQSQFIRVISELEEQAAFFENRKKAIELLSAIPKFEAVAEDLNFEDLGGDPLYRLKDLLTRTSLKWVDITADSTNALKIFIRISQAQTTLAFFHEQGAFVQRLKGDVDAFEAVYWKMAELGQYAILVKDDPRVERTVEDQLTDYLTYLLSQTDPAIPQLKQLSQSVSSKGSYQSILNFLSQKAYRTRQSDTLLDIISYSSQLKTDLNEVDFFVPSYLLQQPGEIVVSSLDKLILNGARLPQSLVKQVFETVETRQLENIIVRITQMEISMINPQLIPFVIHFSERALEQLESYGQLAIAERLRIKLSEIRMFLFNETSDVQGFYKLKMEGVTYQLSLVRNSLQNLAAVLHTDFHDFSMVTSFYTDEGDVLISRYHITGIDSLPNSAQNYILRLTHAKNGVIRGTFNTGTKIMSFKSKRFKKIGAPFKAKAVKEKNIEGIYVGKTNRKGLSKLRLSLNRTGRVVTGTLVINPHDLALRLTFTNGVLITTRNLVSLTSGETRAGNVIHLRGTIVGNTFKGEYIAGGRFVQNIVLYKQ